MTLEEIVHFYLENKNKTDPDEFGVYFEDLWSIHSLEKQELKVSRMCFGALIIGPLQVNLSVEDGARVIREALDRGSILLIAELYGTYDHIREACKGLVKPVVATKCYAWNKEGAAKVLRMPEEGWIWMSWTFFNA